MFPLTHLSILCLDPVMVKTMSPEVAFVTIGGVVLPAIDTVGGVRTQHSFSHGEDRVSCLSISLAASGESTVVLSSMGSHTKGALQLKHTAS